ncbi:hypothetical protein C4N9_12495 [Pararhodobacter marinus]|uniref:DUF6455 domain-containing protein n=1 Tax=Pararhodobacter marinus TaxID=2184063 RepID=A0A2U2C8G9_9RHOB|nr:DUF6455 family protein [Pararhodobacter marinus]PWE28163.1 hypothetical protein C4N9_12495 [Pararhodobacter marinus]
MMERFLRMFRLSRDLHEINALSDAELADMGVTRTEALQLVALPDEVPARVAEMARLFGLSMAELMADRRVWHEVLGRCNGCTDPGTCHRFMAREEPGASVDTATLTFCPNRATFDELAQGVRG